MRIIYRRLLYWVKSQLVIFQNRATLLMISFGYLKLFGVHKFIRLGSAYGGWYVSTRLLNSTKKKILVSAGLGHDVSFDLEMLRNDFRVIGLDPLNSSCLYANEKLSDFQGRFEILNFGLWKESGSVVFYAPIIPEHDSWSILNVQESDSIGVMQFPVLDLDSLAILYGDLSSSQVKILKMDIEGAEQEMFESITNFSIRFDQVSVEMDFVSLVKFRQLFRRIRNVIAARDCLKLMKNAGYELQNIDYFNFTWVAKD